MAKPVQLQLLAILLVVLTACSGTRVEQTDRPPTNTLVLYDTSGPYGTLGELYAMQVGNLVSHFGTWKAQPVGRYSAGDISRHTAVVYVGSTYDEPLPPAFLDDVAASTQPILWLNDNIWQLVDRHPDVRDRLGFAPDEFDPSKVTEVRYKGVSFPRDPADDGGIVRVNITDPQKARSIAEVVRADGTTVPWGVRSGPFTYIGEVPLTFVGPDDRYLAFSDVLFDVFAPETSVRHRALVRIEDVGPHSDPARLREIADYLADRHIPFAVAAFVDFRDPEGRSTDGVPVHRTLSRTPEVVEALKYMQSRGGTLLMHGYTHQYGDVPNPYNVSGDDFEFYRAHVDSRNTVVLDGPVPDDSPEFVEKRLNAARAEWRAAGFSPPTIFEFPHYAASAVDYAAITADTGIVARYERAMYFSGQLSGAPVTTSPPVSQFFPYPVRDVYGKAVIPENLGNVSIQGFNQHQARTAEDILASARRQLVVRDNVASFFYHPFLGLQHLSLLVESMQSMGYTFVAADTLILPPPA